MPRKTIKQQVEEARAASRAVTMTWKEVPLTVVRAVVFEIDGDGHCVYDPETFGRVTGTPGDLVLRHTEVVHSPARGGNPKYMIFAPDGSIQRISRHVYGLVVLRAIVRDLGIEAENSFMGRGYEARFLTEKITTWLDEKGVPATVTPADQEAQAAAA